MALDATPEKSRLGAASIAQQYATNEALNDVLAELLLQSDRIAISKRWIDPTAWYAVALRDTHNPRYTEILRQARQKYTDKKILKAIDAAIVSVGGATDATVPGGKLVAQYSAGEIDLEKKRADLERVLLANQKPAKGYSNIQPGQSLAQVLDSMGTPTDFTALILPIAKWGRTNRLVGHYAGAGMLIFRFDRAVKPQWVVAEPVDEPFDIKAVYAGKQFGVAQTLGSLRGESFRLYLKVNNRSFSRDASLLAVLGERLIALPYPADRYEEDGMEIAIKFVSRSKDPASTDLLRRIAATSGSKVPKIAQVYVTKRERAAAAGGTPADDEKDAVDSEDNESAPDEDAAP
jgi:hypothetical protein